jgi:SAM-dependent methyltransferase
MLETIEKFVAEFAASLASDTFVKLTLGNYKGADEHLQKLNIRRVQTKKGSRLFFLYRHDTRDTAKNYEVSAAIELVRKMLGTDFLGGHLFTTANDFQLDIGKKGRARLNLARPTFKTAPSTQHDRTKKTQVDPTSFYLKALGITDDNGRVRDRQQDKWRQINKFVEILGSLVDKSALNDRRELRIVDMGAGKGYLTFAAYDYFTDVRGVDVRMTGVDTKRELVALCDDIAKASEFDGLHFVVGTIAEHDVGEVDILIALHACNTATDEAIYKGIKADADLIIAVPCCHQELRPQIKPPAMFRDVLKHGIMLEREAEMLTDGLRSLLLERSGYSTKLFEFVAVEHTPKNNMLVGTKLENPVDIDRFEGEVTDLKAFYGIREQRLETLLAKI